MSDTIKTHTIDWDSPKIVKESRNIWECEHCGRLAVKHNDDDPEWYGSATVTECPS